jgi:hypothetical protein
MKLKRMVYCGVFLCLAGLFVGSLATPEAPAAADPMYLYRVQFLRAAPGKLLDLINLHKDRMTVYDAAGDERPLWWRHTQGDQWDLMFLYPMESYAEFYSPARVAGRQKAFNGAPLSQAEFARKNNECVSWHEEIFVTGPQLEPLKKVFHNNAYYHVEIFISLPGKLAELLKEREMESAYQKAIGRPETFLFRHDAGASWDAFTLGCYRDLQHWAGGGETSREKRDAAARAAGFQNSDAIGPYMRSLILMHRDSMGVAIK